ncbi:bifunctional phosphatase PAP2/diacylglycerol kinase family protein [Lysobacter korlensis]|uniref:undecaprenyl-diphosphate phosphatase n=1 Tax=Lysobacter korlensis TaxID=553636 RepID=A0ABV6RXZ9_9GAMM
MPLRGLRNPKVALRRRQLLPSWVRHVDTKAARKINARRVLHPLVDRGYQRLSHAADRGVLWFTFAAVLAVLGRHRAALRGVASLTAASILANLVGKEVFGGDRPLLKDVPIGRHLRKQPTSGSFPSGHSASAAAFATGVALESTAAGGVVAPVAAGVAYSRLHTGAHWLSDVIGGIALGAGVAAIGRLVLPARPATRDIVAPHLHRVELPAIPDGAGVFILVNRDAGSTPIHHDLGPAIADHLPRAVVRYFNTGETAKEVVDHAIASEHPPRVLGVAGGDGTVAAVAHEARKHNLPLLVIPGGTFNHFARTAGVFGLHDGLHALADGEGIVADVADLRFADQEPVTVINTASVGIYPDFIQERAKHERRWGRWIAGVIGAARVLRKSDPVEVSVNGRRARVWSLFVGVDQNFPGMVATLKRRHLEDGVLDVRVLHAGTRPKAVAALAFGHRTTALLRFLRLLPATTEIESFTAETVRVSVRPRHGQPPGFSHDGEVSPEVDEATRPDGGYVTTLQIVPDGLRVYTPLKHRRHHRSGG